jgi:hypothetical protein
LLFKRKTSGNSKIVEEYRALKVFAKREVAFEEKQTEVGSNSTFKLRCELELALVPCIMQKIYRLL